MKRIYGDELKKIQIDILNVVTEFCDKNNINYWIDCGTLLGAIRHKGYIPWDDDIDIGMLRPDYDRFLALFNQVHTKYKVYSIENNPDFYYAFAKVLDTETTLYEFDHKGNRISNTSINIDIFVYDHVPDAKAAKKTYLLRDLYHFCHLLHGLNLKPERAAVIRIGCEIVRFLLKPFPKNFFVKKISANSKRYCNREAEYVGNFTAVSKILCSKKVFADFTTAEFEGKHYKIPIGYDEWLRCFYNDYMKLPPVEKQVSHHIFEAYINE